MLASKLHLPQQRRLLLLIDRSFLARVVDLSYLISAFLLALPCLSFTFLLHLSFLSLASFVLSFYFIYRLLRVALL